MTASIPRLRPRNTRPRKECAVLEASMRQRPFWHRVKRPPRHPKPHPPHQAHLRPRGTPLAFDETAVDRDECLRMRHNAGWHGWYLFDPQCETWTWYRESCPSPWLDVWYRRRRRRGRLRHPPQSLSFKAAQHMPAWQIADLYAAHGEQARVLFAEFDDYAEELQICLLVYISHGYYDRYLEQL